MKKTVLIILVLTIPDFEYVRPNDREYYNEFLRRVVASLHPQGLTVSTALAPKITAGQTGLLYEAHDYQHMEKLWILLY